MFVEPTGLPAPLRGRTLIMGIVNVTPDSFSDGGRFLESDRAIAHGFQLAREGAGLVDIGGESTRPGADRVDDATERARVLPVVRALSEAGVAVSIDTMHADTAIAAVEAGAAVVNDVSGGLADADMLAAMAELDVPYVCMHWRGHADRMDDLATYDDVVVDVRAELAARLGACELAGIAPERVVLDPGLGFAKRTEHNWQILHRLDELAELGRPIIIGASRKRFLGSLLADPTTGEARPAIERDDATAAVSAIAAARGVWAVRVHRVASTFDAVSVGIAWRQG